MHHVRHPALPFSEVFLSFIAVYRGSLFHRKKNRKQNQWKR